MCKSERCKKFCSGLVVVLIALAYVFLLLFTLGLFGFGCTNSDLMAQIYRIFVTNDGGYIVAVSCIGHVSPYEQPHAACLNAIERNKVLLTLPKHEFISADDKVYSVAQVRCRVDSAEYHESINQTLIILMCFEFFKENTAQPYISDSTNISSVSATNIECINCCAEQLVQPGDYCVPCCSQ